MEYMSIYSPCGMSDACPICLDDSDADADTVGHSGRGRAHPAHRNCLKLWLDTHDRCPFCQELVDRSSLFSLKERCFIELKREANAALAGIVNISPLTLASSLSSLVSLAFFARVGADVAHISTGSIVAGSAIGAAAGYTIYNVRQDVTGVAIALVAMLSSTRLIVQNLDFGGAFEGATIAITVEAVAGVVSDIIKRKIFM